jgi:hypothetical protein
MELPALIARSNMRMVTEIVKRAPVDCPNKLVAVQIQSGTIVTACWEWLSYAHCRRCDGGR